MEIITASEKTIWEVNESRQKDYISLLVEKLPELRADIGISQDEIASVMGLSRQTVSSIETGARSMSWATYLSLLLFFDCNEITHKKIRDTGIYPYELLITFNGGKKHTVPKWLADVPDEIVSKLDADAYQTILTTVMLQYSRCSRIHGAEVVKKFENFGVDKTEHDGDIKEDTAIKENSTAD